MQVVATNIYSTPAELSNTLRWIAVKSDRVPCDLCASTGVHTGRDVIKILLAGGAATQVASTIYNNGFSQINTMLKEIEAWMAERGYNYIDQFAGKMNSFETDAPASYERIQFMKYYSQVGKGS